MDRRSFLGVSIVASGVACTTSELATASPLKKNNRVLRVTLEPSKSGMLAVSGKKEDVKVLLEVFYDQMWRASKITSHGSDSWIQEWNRSKDNGVITGWDYAFNQVEGNPIDVVNIYFSASKDDKVKVHDGTTIPVSVIVKSSLRFVSEIGFTVEYA